MKHFLQIFVAIGVASVCACNSGGGRRQKADASGVFEATEVVVSAQASGLIMQLDIEEGTLLMAGQQIGYIDTIPLYLKKLQLSASLKAVESRKTDIPKQIAAINAQISTQQHELQRFEHLLLANAANQKQVDDIRASINVLEKQLAAQTDLLQNSNKSITQELLALEMQIAQIDDQIVKSIITCPINGTVLVKYAECAELGLPGRALFKVADMEHLYLRAYLTSAQLSQIKLGQKVTVWADFGEKEGKSYEGRLSWISSRSEFTPKNIQTRNERDNLVYAVKIAVPNDGYLKIGMYGEVRF
ncbi:MAG: efflux RND transporter periplasmic adaptor subunit [Bacteroidetes bacterium]|nr:efflux RND transporter periplasmic adaptor subunit [Bacteroidota bacterium]